MMLRCMIWPTAMSNCACLETSFCSTSADHVQSMQAAFC